ncbi:lysoplasmalogenase [Phycicoccus sonneratiae]|uniref:Lysoplasmalogenase n=1 Tax=Phycicoccus sonneratiae TaxID=2807628 RepID=A0ABS2CKA7_9MICO|nr:lysoplasmalogenase [Phycicoccus sonneraticus]MBM6400323.1 lysoplasmalogenase [Phycicoccus sonneraticus]
MPAAVVLAAALTTLIAGADWWAVVTRRPAVERWAKPAVMVGLAALAVALGATASTPGVLVLASLALGLVGDVVLLDDGQTRFLGGLAAFLVGHLAWVAAFVTLGLDRPVLGWLGVAVVAAALAAGRRILPASHADGGTALAVPVAFYMAVIAAMAVTGWATGHLLVGLGASLFVVSDTALALGRFVEQRAWTAPVVIVTYHLAQALLVAGMLV